MNFNAKLVLASYYIFEVRLPDVTDVEYDRRVFKKLKIRITKFSRMYLDYWFEYECVEVVGNNYDEIVAYDGPYV